jgi:hypothetical protein
MNEHGNLYSNHQQRLNTIVGESGQIWAKIGVANREYQSSNTATHSDFATWLQSVYGIKIGYSDGVVNLKYEVVDEAKMLVFLLRY